MSDNNPYAPQGNNSADSTGAQQPAYGNYTDPAAQYSAQSQSPYSAQGNPADQSNAYGGQPTGYGQQAPYGAPAYQQFPQQAFDQQGFQRFQGEKDAQTSMILGIIGLVLSLGLILGPIGLHYAKKAERAGASATAGKVLGWINVILAILFVLGIIAFIAFGATMASDPDFINQLEQSTY